MADSEMLQSNLVIATKFARPDVKEAKVLFTTLKEIDKRLTALTSKPHIIRLEVDDSALKKFNLGLQQSPVSTGKLSGPGAAGGALGGAGGTALLRRQSQVIQEGELKSLENSQKIQDVKGGILQTEIRSNDQVRDRQRLIREELDLAKKLELTSKRRGAERAIQARLSRSSVRSNRLADEGEQLARSVASDVSRGQFPLTLGPDSGNFLFDRIAAFERRAVTVRKQIADDNARQAKEAKALADRSAREELAARTKTDARIAASHVSSFFQGKKEEERINKRIATEQARFDKTIAAQHFKEFERAAKQSGIGEAVNQAIASGFKEGPDTRTFDALTNSFQRTRNLTRVTGNAFSGYTVEVLKANEATGKMIGNVLQGSQAMRFLGDSVVRAVAKVSLWALATTAIFIAANAISTAADNIKELESNTVLLSRVGKSFTGDTFEAAKNLTAQIIELTTVIGGSATEAQRAAAIFARAGQNQEEVLLSVRAALLASRIAELEVEDAARLLSAAMLQFGITAREILPTLDSLNTLSNNYRVTTDDLLQSISRTGSVYAEHNGRLSELAAITAVVSQATARSGSEIGNALKTIQSNLDRIDTQKLIFDKLGISSVNFAGEAKSLGEILIELQSRIESLSTSEQKQLTLQIAGVRQRNILIAAIHNAGESIIAENKALTQAGSSQSEFEQTARTLGAALERLQATLIQVANLGGGPLFKVFTSLVNIIDVALRMLSVLNGLPIKVIVLSGAFLLLNRGVSAVIAQLYSLYTATQATIVAQRVAAAATMSEALAHIQASRAVGVHAVALRGLQTVSATTGAVLASIFSPAGLVTTGLILGTALLGSAAEANNTYAASVQNVQTSLENSISAEEKRRTAIVNSVNALAKLQREQAKLRSQGKNKQADDLAKEADKIARSADIGISSGNLPLPEIVARAREAQQASLARERTKLEELRTIESREEAKARERRKAAIDRSRRLSEAAAGDTFISGGVADITAKRFSSIENLFSSDSELISQALAEASAELEAANQGITDSKQKQLDLQNKINDLKEREFELGQNQAELDRLQTAILKDRVTAVEFRTKQEVDSFRASLEGGAAIKNQKRSYEDIVAESDKQLGNLKAILDLTKEIGTEQFEDDFKRVNDLLEKRVEITKKLREAQVSSSEKSISTLLGGRNRLFGGASAIESERQRGLSNTASSFGDDIASIDQKRQAALDRIRQNEIALGNTSINTAGTGANQAIRKDTQEAINELRDLEIDKALSILEAEKNIAIERKKSADEAARALGTLSEEDKLRVRAQAAFFAANPNRRLTLDEQFANDAASNKITQQFFGGRLEDYSESKGILADTLGAAGLGVTNDIARGEAEARAARAGRTDKELLSGAINRFGRGEDQSRAIGGEDATGIGRFAAGALGPQTGTHVDANGKSIVRVEAGIKDDTIDFQPLADILSKAFEEKINKGLEEIADEVRKILEEQDALNARRRPNTANSPS
jgi:TP901 family phage tail tape measure protein